MFLINSCLGSFAAADPYVNTQAGSPYPEVTDASVAEFLNTDSSDHLSILYPPTCVGLRYGNKCFSKRSFSGRLNLFFLSGLRREQTWHNSSLTLINQQPCGFAYRAKNSLLTLESINQQKFSNRVPPFLAPLSNTRALSTKPKSGIKSNCALQLYLDETPVVREY